MELLRELPDILVEAKKIYEECPPMNCNEVERFLDGDNVIAEGDNLPFMKYLIENENMRGKIKVIYVDPPFFTKMKHEAVVKIPGRNENISVPAYTDRWEEGEKQYFLMLASRLYAMRELISDDGCLWVHLDWHIAHYIKIVLDEIFGYDNFINEVVWTYKSGGSSKRHFSRKHDTLLFYGKTKKYYFNPQKEKSYNRGFKPYRFKGVEEFCDDTGWYTMVNMKDVWNIDMVGRTSKERTGYATQKPVALIQRILLSCSEEGDICADFFGGSGTLALAAAGMKRRFISCDGGILATAMCRKRLAAEKIPFRVVSEKGFTKEEGNLISPLLGRMCIADLTQIIKERENSTEAVDFFSVDWDYDGITHRSSEISWDKKSDNWYTLQGSAGENSRISILITDILGNTSQIVTDNPGGIV